MYKKFYKPPNILSTNYNKQQDNNYQDKFQHKYNLVNDLTMAKMYNRRLDTQLIVSQLQKEQQYRNHREYQPKKQYEYSYTICPNDSLLQRGPVGINSKVLNSKQNVNISSDNKNKLHQKEYIVGEERRFVRGFTNPKEQRMMGSSSKKNKTRNGSFNNSTNKSDNENYHLNRLSCSPPTYNKSAQKNIVSESKLKKHPKQSSSDYLSIQLKPIPQINRRFKSLSKQKTNYSQQSVPHSNCSRSSLYSNKSYHHNKKKSILKQFQQKRQNQKLVEKLLCMKPSKSLSRENHLKSFKKHIDVKNIMIHKFDSQEGRYKDYVDRRSSMGERKRSTVVLERKKSTLENSGKKRNAFLPELQANNRIILLKRQYPPQHQPQITNKNTILYNNIKRQKQRTIQLKQNDIRNFLKSYKQNNNNSSHYNKKSSTLQTSNTGLSKNNKKISNNMKHSHPINNQLQKSFQHNAKYIQKAKNESYYDCESNFSHFNDENRRFKETKPVMRKKIKSVIADEMKMIRTTIIDQLNHQNCGISLIN